MIQAVQQRPGRLQPALNGQGDVPVRDGTLILGADACGENKTCKTGVYEMLHINRLNRIFV
jgi:hypothetical protein